MPKVPSGRSGDTWAENLAPSAWPHWDHDRDSKPPTRPAPPGPILDAHGQPMALRAGASGWVFDGESWSDGDDRDVSEREAQRLADEINAEPLGTRRPREQEPDW